MIMRKNKAVLCLTLLLAAGAQAAGQQQGGTVVLGAGAGYVPEYAGSDDGHAIPVINADYQRADGFFAGVLRGVGYGTKVNGVSLSAALAYDGGRDDKKRALRSGSDDLRGMGKISGAALGKLQAGFDVGPVVLSVGADLALSKRERGNTYQLGVAMPLVADQTNQVTAALTSKYRDDKSMQTYFGVNRTQSLNSGYRAYQAGGGFESVSLNLNWNRIIDKTWSLNTTVGVSTLTGDAADSPLTKRKTSPMVLGMFNYRF